MFFVFEKCFRIAILSSRIFLNFDEIFFTEFVMFDCHSPRELIFVRCRFLLIQIELILSLSTKITIHSEAFSQKPSSCNIHKLKEEFRFLFFHHLHEYFICFDLLSQFFLQFSHQLIFDIHNPLLQTMVNYNIWLFLDISIAVSSFSK